jgi:hypothetical protein
MVLGAEGDRHHREIGAPGAKRRYCEHGSEQPSHRHAEWTGGFAAPVSGRHFPISVSAYPRPVRYVTETGLRSRFRACTAAKVDETAEKKAATGRGIDAQVLEDSERLIAA